MEDKYEEEKKGQTKTLQQFVAEGFHLIGSCQCRLVLFGMIGFHV